MQFDFENANYFDLKRVQEYNLNPWEKENRLGLYFTALKDEGVNLDIPIGIDIGEGMKWYKTPHALHDGFSALCTLFRELNISHDMKAFDIPKLKFNPSMITSSFKAIKGEEHFFKGQKPYSHDQNFRYFVLKNKDEKQCLSTILKKVSDYLLCHGLDQKMIKWMIPVRTNNEEGLSASYLSLPYEQGQSVGDIKNSLRKKLKIGEYKGVERLSHLALKLGPYVIKSQTRKMLQLKHPGWGGSVSFLKDLGHAKEVKELIMIAPVRWHRPIGVALYRFNSINYLTFAIHSSLSDLDLVDLKEVLSAST